MKKQHSLMKFDPATGDQKPYPSHADQWREYQCTPTAWLFNPWSGERRDACNIGNDPFGKWIIPPGAPVYAAKKNAGLFFNGDVVRALSELRKIRLPRKKTREGTKSQKWQRSNRHC